jgi:hypothetical protein
LYYNENTLYYFQDIYDPYNESNNIFIRIIGNFKLYYYNGECYILSRFDNNVHF